MAVSLARLRELVEYDPETGDFRWKVNRRPRGVAGAVAGTIARNGYRYIPIDGARYLAHRLAWFWHYGRWPCAGVDHINGYPRDNRITNLREATQSQNMANCSRHKDSISGIKGVSPKRNKWEARIRGLRLGTFSTKEEAHAAYCAKAKEVFGDFARTE